MIWILGLIYVLSFLGNLFGYRLVNVIRRKNGEELLSFELPDLIFLICPIANSVACVFIIIELSESHYKVRQFKFFRWMEGE
jgi:hypothetical protein